MRLRAALLFSIHLIRSSCYKNIKVADESFPSACNVRGFFDMDACKGICEAKPEGLSLKETQLLIVTSSIHSIDEFPCLQYTASFIIRYVANTAGLATKT